GPVEQDAPAVEEKRQDDEAEEPRRGHHADLALAVGTREKPDPRTTRIRPARASSRVRSITAARRAGPGAPPPTDQLGRARGRAPGRRRSRGPRGRRGPPTPVPRRPPAPRTRRARRGPAGPRRSAWPPGGCTPR